MGNNIQLEENSMLRRRPELLHEWDFDKNEELGLDVYKITFGSTKKAWWKCPVCGSSYDMQIEYRSGKQRSNCPFCSSQRVNHTNSLASLRPDIASEWHPTKNGDLTPNGIPSKSSKIVWWKCPDCRSDYNMMISNRTRNNQKCSYCAGKRVNHTNSLASLNPILANEWHPTKNGKLTPDKFTCGSNEKVWWLGKCGHEWDAVINSRTGTDNIKGHGCPYCSRTGATLLKGVNDLWTTNPELARLLLNPKDGYVLMQNSDKKVDWKCSSCGSTVRQKIISNISRRGLSCPKCSDGMSYGEKFIYSLLKVNNIDFYFDKAFKWSKRKRYDFYLPDYNWIIEVHGKQHYEEGNFGGKDKKSRTLAEETKNDRLKEEIALNNGISRYVVLDARHSTIEHLSNSVVSSELSNLITELDFVKIGRLSEYSFVKVACELWNTRNYNTKEIGKEMKLSKTTVVKYLKRGAEIGWCDFGLLKPVVQISLDQKDVKIWGSVKEASDALKIPSQVIYRCLKKLSFTANKSFWMHKEEYEKTKDEIHKREIILGETFRKIVQLDTNFGYIKTWGYIAEAANALDLLASGISNTCRGENATSGGFRWMYQEDYDKYSSGEEVANIKFIANQPKEIIQLSLEGGYVRSWDNVTEASKSLNIHRTHVYAVLSGKQKTAYGYKWVYKEEYDELNDGAV